MGMLLSFFETCSQCSVTTALFTFVTACAVYFFINGRKNYPPGPWGLPILGYTPFLGINPGETVMNLKKRYGSVISLKMGTQTWIILNDYDTVYEALINRPDVFSGRTRNHFFDDVSDKGMGIVHMDYSRDWQKLRKFGTLTLKGFGVGQKGMEVNVVEEATYLVRHLGTKSEDSLRVKLTHAAGNVINRIVFGTRLAYEDETYKMLLRTVDIFLSNTLTAKLIGVTLFLPLLRFVPGFKGALVHGKEELDILAGILKRIIKEHERDYDENNIRDFIDAFLQLKEKNGHAPDLYSLMELRHYIQDLIQAGTGTTTSTMQWIILGLVQYPEYQEKMAKEVDVVLGQEGVPSMRDQEKMPFTCSYIAEVMRHRTQVPFAVFHKTNHETVLNGYTIPKEATVVPNLWAVHHDPALFKDPDVFKPDRFIDEDGKFVSSPHVIPFSVGLRHCLGEQLARLELFVYTVAIVQKLRIVPDPARPPPSFHDGEYTLVTFDCKDYEVNFEHR